MAIFTHVAIGTNDIAKARAFYDGVLGPLGYKRVADFSDGGSAWGETAPEFFVLKPANGQPATFANGGTVSFVAPNRAAVAAFHKAALAAGGYKMPHGGNDPLNLPECVTGERESKDMIFLNARSSQSDRRFVRS